MRVSAFPERVGPQILSRERVDNFGTSEHSSGSGESGADIYNHSPKIAQMNLQ